MREADYVVDIGHGAGAHGGDVAAGTLQDVMDCPRSITGQYLVGKSASLSRKRDKVMGVWWGTGSTGA